MARDAGANKVYMASAAPAVRHQNVYGIDMPSPDELIAHNRTTEQVAGEIGVDRLIYQDLKDLEASVTEGNPDVSVCEASCFDGKYITDGITQEYLDEIEAARNDSVKV
jgi:amidophosphoribosyltransferase